MTGITWAFGVNGSWSDPTKWSGGLVPTGADDVTISAPGSYGVTITAAEVANSLTMNDPNGRLLESSAGSLSLGGAMTLVAGLISLDGANSLGGFSMSGGVLELGNAAALGSATLNQSGGEVTGMATETIGNYINLTGTRDILDAATGTTMTMGANGWSMDASSGLTVQFGSATRRGTIVWNTNGASIASVGSLDVEVAGGTLKAGTSLSFLLGNAYQTNIDAGATLDLGGFGTSIHYLEGAGTVVNSGASLNLIVKGGLFSGAITGAIATDFTATTILEGANTYSLNSTIEAAVLLELEGTGAIRGAVLDNGVFTDADTSGVVTLGPVSGTGSVNKSGAGTLVLNGAGSYAGGTTITGGEVSIGDNTALGTGAIVLDNAELLATTTLAATNGYTLRDNVTLAASTGKTFTLVSGAGVTWDANSAPLYVTIGDALHRGTVILGSSGVSTINYANPVHIKVAYGTLKAGPNLGFITGLSTDLTVNRGAVLDLNGQSLPAIALDNAGTITNSAATGTSLATYGTSRSSGAITGQMSLYVSTGQLTLSAANTYSGGTTIYSGATLQLGYGAGRGSIVGAIDDEGALIIDNPSASTLAGVISGAGSLTQSGAGATTLGGVNTYSGGTTMTRGELIVTNGASLGTGSVALDGGELLATNTMALAATQNTANTFTFKGVNTIAAAAGKTLTIGGAQIDVLASTLNFGQGANNGTVIWAVTAGSATGPFAMNVNAGTLKAGDVIFGELTNLATKLTVAAGATLDVAGFGANVPNLAGAGTITNTSATGAALTVLAGSFAGVISGKIALSVGNLTLSGANTYTGGTTIVSGYTLQLGSASATGSIVGAISDAGVLKIVNPAAISLAGVISGAGELIQDGAGTTTLTAANTFSGQVAIQRGELIVSNTHALGAASVTMTGGELVAGISEGLTAALSVSGAVTLAAAHGTTLIYKATNTTIGAAVIGFGDSTHDGTIDFQSSALSVGSTARVDVRFGTLRATDASLTTILAAISGTRIEAGATLDSGGRGLGINNLTGAGGLTNSGITDVLKLFGTSSFSGIISGKTTLDLYGTAVLTGNETFTGAAVIESGATATLSGLFSESVSFAGGGTLVLTAPSRFTGVIGSFAAGTAIDLKNITTGATATLSYNTATRVLTVSDGSHTDTLKFAGAYVAGNFVATSDGGSGTSIGWQTPPAAAAPAAHAFVGAMAAMGSSGGAGVQLGPSGGPIAATVLVLPPAHAA